MVPTKDEIAPNLLELLADGKEHCFDEVIEKLANVFKLSRRDLEERIPSATTTRFRSNIAWTVTEFVQQKLVERTEKGCFKTINVQSKMPKRVLIPSPDISKKSPDEIMEDMHKQINMKLTQELLPVVKKASPIFFENLVLDLLRKMGYGHEVNAAGKRVGGTGDGGIDGFVKEDQLGFDIIYYQAKRWNGSPVSSKEVREFAGSLDKYHSNKGVLITTSQFTNDARQFVQNLPKKIILIGGEELAQLMIEYGVGTTVSKTYQVKEIDTDYFNERK